MPRSLESCSPSTAVYSVPADQAWLDDMETLWTDVLASNPATVAWQTVLAVMLRDPMLLTY